MSRAVLRTAIDAWVDEADEDANHGNAERLWLKGGANEQQALVHWALPFHPPVDVETAYLYGYLAEDWPGGPHRITAKRLTERWGEHSVTWATKPTHSDTNTAFVDIEDGEAGDEFVIDITALFQDAGDDGVFQGVQMELDTTTRRKIHSAETTATGKKPKIIAVWHRTPQPPTDPRPNGGHVVSDPTPRGSWSFLNEDGDSKQAAYQVQVATAASAGAVYFDTGEVTDPDSYADLGELGLTPLVTGQHRFWRVRAKGGNGVWSEYTDWEEFVYRPLPTAAFTNPTDGGTVEETTPPFTHTFSGSQVRAEYWLFEGDVDETGYGENYGELYGGEGWRVVWHRHQQRDTLLTVHPPNKKIKRHEENVYKIRGRFWDQYDRQGLPGAPTYAEAEATFTLEETSLAAAVDELRLTNNEFWVEAEFDRAAGQPDFWAIKVDGELVEDRIEGDQLFVSGDTYRRRLYGLQPLVEHDVQVIPIVIDGVVKKHTQNNPVESITFLPSGFWVIDPDSDLGVKLVGPTSFSPGLEIGESATNFALIGRRDLVRISDSIRGYEGTLSGRVKGLAMVERIEKFKSAPPQKRFVMLVGHISVTCQIGHISGPTPAGEVPGDPDTNRLWDVAIEVLQTDDWRWRQRL